MRVCWLIALLLACKSDKDKRNIVVTEIVMTVTAQCEAAIDKAASAPIDARPQILIESCSVCDSGRADWKPLLTWNVEPEHGGPKREQIEQQMVACEAFCTGDSKLKFMSAVDKVRGQNVDTPWRQLENACKEKVNGALDDRFMSAPFFALDRIARAAAKSPAAAKLGAIELPLPAATISGAGVALPEVDGVSPAIGDVHITVLGDSISVGRLPRGKLTHAGVMADLGKTGYPGETVKVEQLAAKLTELGPTDKAQPITILAPQGMPAHKLVAIIAAASTVGTVHLGAKAAESPPGWQLAGTIPIALEAGPGIEIKEETTVQNLARELAAHAARKEPRVGVTKR